MEYFIKVPIITCTHQDSLCPTSVCGADSILRVQVIALDSSGYTDYCLEKVKGQEGWRWGSLPHKAK